MIPIPSRTLGIAVTQGRGRPFVHEVRYVYRLPRVWHVRAPNLQPANEVRVS